MFKAQVAEAAVERAVVRLAHAEDKSDCREATLEQSIASVEAAVGTDVCNSKTRFSQAINA